jgi:hypothetical protein
MEILILYSKVTLLNAICPTKDQGNLVIRTLDPFLKH